MIEILFIFMKAANIVSLHGIQQKINLIGHFRKKLLTMAMNFVVQDYSKLKTEKLANT